MGEALRHPSGLCIMSLDGVGFVVGRRCETYEEAVALLDQHDAVHRSVIDSSEPGSQGGGGAEEGGPSEPSKSIRRHRRPRGVSLERKRRQRRAFLAITGACAKVYDLRVQTVLGPRRLPKAVEARHVAMMLTRDTTQASYPTLGLWFGRDHSTVVHAVRRLRSRLDGDDPVAAKVLEVMQTMRGEK